MHVPATRGASTRSERADAIDSNACTSRSGAPGAGTNDARLVAVESRLRPRGARLRPGVRKLVDLDLSRNQLFGSDHVFGMLSELASLRRLNLAETS